MIKTRILLNGQDLELISDVSMPFTYQIADVKNPAAKNTNFSKTITLPGTRINHTIFGYIWDTNVVISSSGTTNFTPSFNPNKKADVQILYDGAEVFRGFMKLDKIKVLSDYQIEYDVSCYGKLKDLFLELGEKTLADLDLSAYNHNYTKDIQVASWNNYIYKNGVTIPFNKGDGYVYPMVDYAMNNNIDWKTEHFFPAIYYKTIINQIITEAGFQYDGSIFDNNDFKSLVVSYGSGNLKLSNTQIENRTFQAQKTLVQKLDVGFGASVGTGSQRNTNPTKIVYPDDSTPPNNDPGNNYNTLLSEFTVPFNALYKFTTYLDISLTHFPSTPTATGQALTWAQGFVHLIVNNLVIATATVYTIASNTSPQANGNIYILLPSTVTSGTTTSPITGSISMNYQCNTGDVVKVEFERYGFVHSTSSLGTITYNNLYNEDPYAVNSYGTLNINTASNFKAEIYNPTVSEGDMVDMSSVLPSTIKQKDFISSFFKMFNIYTEDDRYIDNYLHFEPRPNFYQSSGTIRDWSNKLDFSQRYEVIPMGDLDARTYLYKFKDDGDYWNDYYKKKYGETYGQKRFDIDNDWLSNINTTESIFSPTPLVDRTGDDKILPRIFQINNNGQAVPKTSNLRLWYYGGVKSTNQAYNYVTSSGTTSYSTYAYAGHLDNIASPNYDVNFSVPIEVYYTANTYTNNNLFNLYHKQFIQEITSKDSKIFKGYFHINPLDIAILNFRDLFFFRGDYWILNKIYDYNPTEAGKPTLCEFLKLRGGVPFIGTSGTTSGGGGILGDDTIPFYNNSSPRNENIFTQDNLVSGSGNVLASTTFGSVVVGDNNTTGSGAKMISILSSSGTTVYGGVQKVTLINSNDMTIDNTYEGKVVINGKILGNKEILYNTASYYLDGSESDVFAVFEISNDEACYLPFPSTITDGYNIEVKNANGAAWTLSVIIQSDATTPTWSPGDGSTATQHDLSAGDSYKYTYYNGVWYIH